MVKGKMGFPSQIADDPLLQIAMPAPDSYPFAEERRLFYVASWQKLSGILAMHEITPFSPKGVDYGRIFSRSDIEFAFPKAL